MSTLKEKILAVFAAEETPPAVIPPVVAAPAIAPPVIEPPQPAVPVVTQAVTPEPPGIEAAIEAALAAQKLELEAGYAEKLKGIQSNSTPPPPVAPPVVAQPEGVDFKKWNEKVSEINKRIANQI